MTQTHTQIVTNPTGRASREQARQIALRAAQQLIEADEYRIAQGDDADTVEVRVGGVWETTEITIR